MQSNRSGLQGDKQFQNTTKLQLAKKQLNSIEQKFKRFKQKSRQHTERKHQYKIKRDSNMPMYNTRVQNQSPLVPDLRQYFSFMMEKENQPLFDNVNQNQRKVYQIKPSNFEYQNEKIINKEKNQQQQKRSIQKKLSQQKNIAITNLEQFFTNKKSQLDKKAIQLQETKAKNIQDIYLLKRSNSQLQTQIDIEKNMIYNNATDSLKEKNKMIFFKIQSKKKAIQNLKMNVQKINSRKQQLKKNINQCLKGNKNFIAQDKLSNQC